MSSTNHDQYQQDNSFSGPGDIDRVTGSNTSDRSREANREAADVLAQDAGSARAFPIAGSGGQLSDGQQNHEYGRS